MSFRAASLQRITHIARLSFCRRRPESAQAAVREDGPDRDAKTVPPRINGVPRLVNAIFGATQELEHHREIGGENLPAACIRSRKNTHRMRDWDQGTANRQRAHASEKLEEGAREAEAGTEDVAEQVLIQTGTRRTPNLSAPLTIRRPLMNPKTLERYRDYFGEEGTRRMFKYRLDTTIRTEPRAKPIEIRTFLSHDQKFAEGDPFEAALKIAESRGWTQAAPKRSVSDVDPSIHSDSLRHPVGDENFHREVVKQTAVQAESHLDVAEQDWRQALELLEQMTRRDQAERHLQLEPTPTSTENSSAIYDTRAKSENDAYLDDEKFLIETMNAVTNTPSPHDSPPDHVHAVWSRTRKYGAHPLTIPERIRVPPIWTTMSLMSFVEQLTLEMPPRKARQIERLALRERIEPKLARDYSSRSAALLMEVLTGPLTTPYLSVQTVRTAFAYLARDAKIPEILHLAAILKSRHVRIPKACFEPLLGCVSEHGELRDFDYALRMMGRNGLRPTRRVWICFYALVLRKAGSVGAIIVQDAMRQKGLLNSLMVASGTENSVTRDGGDGGSVGMRS